VEYIALRAAFVFPSSPELSHLRIFLSSVALQCLIGRWVPDNVRNTATLAFSSTTTALDAHTCTAGIGAETILLLPVGVRDIILGNEATSITDKLCLADDVTICILRSDARKATAAVHAACQGLFMRHEDILVTIFLSEALGSLVALDPAPVVVLLLLHSSRDGRRVLHILGLPTGRQTTPHKPRRFLMDPCNAGLIVGIASVEVIRFLDNPVE